MGHARACLARFHCRRPECAFPRPWRGSRRRDQGYEFRQDLGLAASRKAAARLRAPSPHWASLSFRRLAGLGQFRDPHEDGARNDQSPARSRLRLRSAAHFRSFRSGPELLLSAGRSGRLAREHQLRRSGLPLAERRVPHPALAARDRTRHVSPPHSTRSPGALMLDATPLGRLYASRRSGALAREDSVLVQQQQLLTLIGKAADTRFGRDHGFGAIKTVDDFQRRTPLRKYETMWGEYWKPTFPQLIDCSWPGKIPYFALSSGTTSGTTKYIPCSREMIRANRRAALNVLVHHLANRPQSRVLGGANFMLGGSTDLNRLADGVFAGDLSGIAAASAPSLARRRI